MSDVDIFVGSQTIVDQEVYQLWLDGHSAQEAVVILQQRGVLQETGAPIRLLMSDTLNHYRTFQMLERLLQYPTKLAEQLTFQIEPQTQKMLIQKYYEFHDDVVRDVLGKKLSSRNRKDLDEVSEKTGVSLRSCRRQFDNVKRVYKIVEDLKGNLFANIQANFLLPDVLARKYAAIVFITNNRFETGKRKLQYLTFDDFLHCANCMISKWSAYRRQDETDADLDREFLQEMRDLKVLLDKDVIDEHKSLVIHRLKGKIPEKLMTDIDTNFKVLSRTLINIAYGLNHSREARDIFVDLVEKFIDPCKQSRWSKSDLEQFLNVYASTPRHLELMRSFPHVIAVFDRYITTASSCLLRMYHG